MKKLIIFLVFSLIFFLLIPLPEIHPPYSTILKDREGRTLHTFLSENQQWRFQMEDDVKIPEKLKITIILAEDKRFYLHPGFDPLSLTRALFINIKGKKILQGGSTITMQTVRILDPKERTIPVKIKEIIQAIKLEMLYSKEEILRIYLSNVPMGGNLSGIRAGSFRYFGKDIEELTWAECATLAAILKSPKKAPLKNNEDFLKEKRDRILKILKKHKVIDDFTFSTSIREPLPSKIFPFPKYAPHFSWYLYKEKMRGNLTTSLNLNLQNLVEAIGINNYSRLKGLGINSYSIVVLDTKSGEILAYVGSPSFYDKRDGQVDGVQAPRSTGSILKPFLYALYLDKGLGTEKTLLPDFPMHFGNFSPENSDREYRGAVSFKEALTSSLNIPAVFLLHRYGAENFYNFLKKAEVSTLSYEPSRYGLSLIIGGAEGKLIEITNLYRILSNGGNWSPFTYHLEEEIKTKKRLISEGSAYIIYNILQDLKRPEAIYYSIYPEKNKFAWKTGTSFKQRDAWAIGTNENYTIGVWAGNFSGEGNQNIMGASISGPLLFQIFSMLPEEKKEKIKKSSVKEYLVCEKSGLAPTEECEKTTLVLVPENVRNLPLCPYHKSFFLDESKNRIVCSACWGEGVPVKKSFFILTPKMRYYSQLAGIPVDEIPPHNPFCKIQQTGNIKIIYPEEGTIIKIPREFDGSFQKIVLKVGSLSREKELQWLLDNNPIAKTRGSAELSIEIEEGNHFFQVLDEEGNSASVKFKVIKSFG
ncbi:MAG: penicillin-binding protein 1C [Thermoanaerobaculia bacterium]